MDTMNNLFVLIGFIFEAIAIIAPMYLLFPLILFAIQVLSKFNLAESKYIYTNIIVGLFPLVFTLFVVIIINYLVYTLPKYGNPDGDYEDGNFSIGCFSGSGTAFLFAWYLSICTFVGQLIWATGLINSIKQNQHLSQKPHKRLWGFIKLTHTLSLIGVVILAMMMVMLIVAIAID